MHFQLDLNVLVVWFEQGLPLLFQSVMNLLLQVSHFNKSILAIYLDLLAVPRCLLNLIGVQSGNIGIFQLISKVNRRSFHCFI